MKLAALFTLLIGLAAAEAQVTVRVTGAAARQSPTLHVFNAPETEFSAVLSSPANIVAGSVIEANLYQLAGSIAAPFAQHIAVVPRANGEAAFKVDLSSIRQVTAMELRFTTQSPGSTRQNAGSARVLVYPEHLLAQMKKQLEAAKEKTRLTVIGESPRLKAILREAGIAFRTADSFDAVGHLPLGLFLGEADATRARASIDQAPPESSLMLFTEDPDLPAGVYWTQRRGGFVAKITLPVLADFGRAPERQMLFLRLIQRALECPPTLP